MPYKKFSLDEFAQDVIDRLQALERQQAATDAVLRFLVGQLQQEDLLDAETFRERLLNFCDRMEAQEAPAGEDWTSATAALCEHVRSFADLISQPSEEQFQVIPGGKED